MTVPRRRRPALVTTEHNTWGSHRWATRWANRLTGGFDEVTFAVTDEARQSMRGAAARRAEVLVHGIDIDAHRGPARGRAGGGAGGARAGVR